MKIEIIPKKADSASQELLELSRSLRRAREETEDLRRQLRSHSQLEECRHQLQKQEEALMLSTIRIVDMSCALKEIADLYQTAEENNAEHLEERAAGNRIRGDVVVFGTNGSVSNRIRTILNQ